MGDPKAVPLSRISRPTQRFAQHVLSHSFHSCLQCPNIDLDFSFDAALLLRTVVSSSSSTSFPLRLSNSKPLSYASESICATTFQGVRRDRLFPRVVTASVAVEGSRPLTPSRKN